MMSIRVAVKATFILALLAVATIQGRQQKQPPHLLFGLETEESDGMKPSFKDKQRDILSHLRRILPAQSAATSTAINGYFYAQYYSKANCSSGSGFVSYVEGYATGLCFHKANEISGLPSGSVTQTCNPKGTYCPIMLIEQECLTIGMPAAISL